MKIILMLFALLFVNNVFTDENAQTPIDEVEVPVLPKKIAFSKPHIPDNYFLMYFTAPSNLAEHLVASQATKDDVEEVIARYDGIWSVEVPQTSAIEEDYALVLKSKARHAAISAKLNKPFDFTSDQLVVQYEVKFQNGQECGGAYIKLLSQTDNLNLKQFHDKTQYTIMFGPDRCGNDNKLHFIFQHKHPLTGKFEEKHAKKPSADIERHFTDKKTHLYTLVLNSDNTFEVYVDQSLVNSGHLLKDFEPAVNPAKEIDDPSDIKPAEWDDNAKIVDVTATKPDGWDEDAVEFIEDKSAQMPSGWLLTEPLTVADDKAEKPSDWDDEMDGEWEAPRVENPLCKAAPGCGPWTAPTMKNPEYKGKWSPPMIDNPGYRGPWSPRRISNPDHFEDDAPYRMTPIGALGIELWSMSDEIAFDNFLIVNNKKAADDFAAETWAIKKDAERMADPNAQSVVDAIREATTERPWLWLVLVAVVALPVILIVVYCCRSSTTTTTTTTRRPMVEKDDEAAAAVHKKDDDEGVVADTIVDEDDAEPETVVNETGDTAPSMVNGGTDKADLETDEDEEDHHGQADGPAEEATVAVDVASGHVPLPSSETGSSSSSSSDQDNTQSEGPQIVTKKRRARKD